MTVPQGQLASSLTAPQGQNQLLPWLVGHVLEPEAPRWDVLARIAAASVPAADAASVVLPGDRTPGIAVGSDVAAAEADRYQLSAREGPALLAAGTQAMVQVPDVAADRRWPRFGRHAAAVGLRSALCVPAPDAGEGPVVLTVYSRRRQALGGPEAREAAALLREFLAAARAMSAAHHDALHRLDVLQESAHARALVEQAKGIVMSENRCTPDEAFAELRSCAMRRNLPLQALAEQIVARAVRPWDDAFPRRVTWGAPGAD